MLPDGRKVFAGLSNSFIPQRDPRKRRYLTLTFSLLLLIEVAVLIAFSWQYEPREIPYSSIAVDLGDFRPRARRAPVVEVDEVFGNQYVKEKKAEATALPVNEAGGTIDGEGVVDLDVEGAGAGGVPNIARCAVRNFPQEAKAYVDEALVLVSILVDKTGLVREAKPLYASFKKNLPPELKERMKKLFLDAARASLLGRRCPVFYVNGVATGYRLEVPLSYELYN